MKFSIVVPTYNEEADIRGTLSSLLALRGDHSVEILIVDDSNDNTPTIVREYEKSGVILIHPGGGGRCEARNLGIQRSTGEVVVILNADARPRVDFLDRLADHYRNGADYVVVRSHVSNMEGLLARYVACVAENDYVGTLDPDKFDWSEGFSVRRDVALRTNLFPTGYTLPICAGEDGYFGQGLRRAGAHKKVDFSIVVDHVAPSAFGEFWSVRKGRGGGSAQMHRFIFGWSHSQIIAWNTLKTLRSFVQLGLVVPRLMHCMRASAHSPFGKRDVVPFYLASIAETVAVHVGEWETTFKIISKERKK